MKRLVLAALVIAAAGITWTGDEGARASESRIQVIKCGEYLPPLVPVSAKLAELMTVMADGMDAHAVWMGATSKDKAARADRDAFKKLAKDHRGAAASMKRVVADLNDGSRMAPAPHDMSKADPKTGERLMKQVALERELAALLIKRAGETEKMLQAMAANAASK